MSFHYSIVSPGSTEGFMEHVGRCTRTFTFSEEALSSGMADLESGTIAVLAEKPSVARDIARELGASSRGTGYLHGNRYVVTWAVGHLVSLAQPHEINPEWRKWRRSLLPMLPSQWPLVVYEKTKDQFELVKR